MVVAVCGCRRFNQFLRELTSLFAFASTYTTKLQNLGQFYESSLTMEGNNFKPIKATLLTFFQLTFKVLNDFFLDWHLRKCHRL